MCTSWGIKGKNLYLLHVLRKRMEYPELKRAVREQRDAFEASAMLIEEKVSGTQLIQELIQEGLHAVTRYQPQSDKTMRMHAQTAMIENGFVHLPKDAGWLAEYLHELSAFPRGKHDEVDDIEDQADLPVARLSLCPYCTSRPPLTMMSACGSAKLTSFSPAGTASPPAFARAGS